MLYHFVDSDLGVEIYSLTKREQQKKGVLILKWGIEELLLTCTGVEEKFMQSLTTFLLFLMIKNVTSF